MELKVAVELCTPGRCMYPLNGGGSLKPRLLGEGPRVEKQNAGISFRPSPAMVSEFRGGNTIVMEETPERKVPHIARVISMEDPAAINAGKPGQMLKVRGSRLRFDPSDEEVGVFLVANNGNVHRAAIFTRTGTSHVDFKLPQIPAGSHDVEIRTRPGQRDVWVGRGRVRLTVTGRLRRQGTT